MNINIKENIRIDKPILLWRCAYCNKEIGVRELSISIYDIERMEGVYKTGKFVQSGNGLRLHINCLDDFYKTIKKVIKDNIKEITLEKL